MSGYVLSRLALQDLLEIWEYIAADNVDAADGVSSDLEQALNMLADNPLAGHLREDLVSQPLRFWLVHSYLIVYRPETKPLEVVRILSAYRDVRELLD